MTGYELATLALGVSMPFVLAGVTGLIAFAFRLSQRVTTLEAEAKLHAETRGAIGDLRAEIHQLGLAIRSLEAKLPCE